jgi:hypothetical protein
MPKRYIPSHMAVVGLILYADPALAYVGPGAGLSAIGSVLAFLGVMALMILGFLWYPAKRLMARLRRTTPTEVDEARDKA